MARGAPGEIGCPGGAGGVAGWSVKDRRRECSRLDVLALPVERWRAFVRSEDRAMVFGRPHGAEGVEVARGAPGDVVRLSRWVRSTLSAAKKAAPVLISYSGKRRAVGRRPSGAWRPRAPFLYERGYPVGLLIVGVSRGDLVGVRGVFWLV